MANEFLQGIDSPAAIQNAIAMAGEMYPNPSGPSSGNPWLDRLFISDANARRNSAIRGLVPQFQEVQRRASEKQRILKNTADLQKRALDLQDFGAQSAITGRREEAGRDFQIEQTKAANALAIQQYKREFLDKSRTSEVEFKRLREENSRVAALNQRSKNLDSIITLAAKHKVNLSNVDPDVLNDMADDITLAIPFITTLEDAQANPGVAGAITNVITTAQQIAALTDSLSGDLSNAEQLAIDNQVLNDLRQQGVDEDFIEKAADSMETKQQTLNNFLTAEIIANGNENTSAARSLLTEATQSALVAKGEGVSQQLYDLDKLIAQETAQLVRIGASKGVDVSRTIRASGAIRSGRGVTGGSSPSTSAITGTAGAKANPLDVVEGIVTGTTPAPAGGVATPTPPHAISPEETIRRAEGVQTPPIGRAIRGILEGVVGTMDKISETTRPVIQQELSNFKNLASRGLNKLFPQDPQQEAIQNILRPGVDAARKKILQRRRDEEEAQEKAEFLSVFQEAYAAAATEEQRELILQELQNESANRGIMLSTEDLTSVLQRPVTPAVNE